MTSILNQAKKYLQDKNSYIKPPTNLLELLCAAQDFEAHNSLGTGHDAKPLWDLYYRACEVR